MMGWYCYQLLPLISGDNTVWLAATHYCRSARRRWEAGSWEAGRLGRYLRQWRGIRNAGPRQWDSPRHRLETQHWKWAGYWQDSYYCLFVCVCKVGNVCLLFLSITFFQSGINLPFCFLFFFKVFSFVYFLGFLFLTFTLLVSSVVVFCFCFVKCFFYTFFGKKYFSFFAVSNQSNSNVRLKL